MLEDKIYFLYRHCYASGPKEGQPFYIGIGVKPPAFRKHNREYERAYFTHGRKKHWNNIVSKYGYIIEIVCDNIQSKDEVVLKEIEFIKLYGRMEDGGMLCNYTNGGEGAFGRKVSEETKLKISLANRGPNYDETEKTRIKKSSRISIDQVVSIKISLNEGAMVKDIAKEVGVEQHTVTRILHNRAYKDVLPIIQDSPRLENGTRLTKHDIICIRQLKRIVSNKDLCEMFKISGDIVVGINQGRYWNCL